MYNHAYTESDTLNIAVLNNLEKNMCRQTSIIRLTLGNKISDHPDVVEASPVGADPTTSSFSTLQLALLDWTKAVPRRD